MAEQQIERFWAEFTAATGIEGAYESWAFGGPDTAALATELAWLVRDGPTRATAGLLTDYEDNDDPLPEPGDLSVILDGDGAPVCVIRTTEVETTRFGDVDEGFAWDEGEGDRTLSYWREAHLAFFAGIGLPVNDDTMMVLSRFELLWPRQHEPSA